MSCFVEMYLTRVLRVWTYDALGDCLTDGVDLGSVSTTADADSYIDIGCEYYR